MADLTGGRESEQQKVRMEEGMLLENGTYRAVVKDISVYLRGENERLTAAFRLACEGKELKHLQWLELNDGTISDKTIKRLRECFPKWDGSIETLEQGFCVQDVEVEVTVENEQDKQDPEKWWTRTKFMDPPGGGSSGAAALPDKESRATLVSKYGARFRALAHSTGSGQAGVAPAGGVRSQKTEARSPAGGPPTAKAPAKPAAAKAAASSTLEECWDSLCKRHPDEMREQVGDRWFEILARVVPGKDQGDFGPEDWGRVLADVALPF